MSTTRLPSRFRPRLYDAVVGSILGVTLYLAFFLAPYVAAVADLVRP